MINWITNTRRSFSAKLSLWILLLTVPVFFASVGLLFHQSHRMIYGESVERANGVLDASLQRIGRYLITIETMTNTYSWMAERSMNPEMLKGLTNRVLLLNPYADGCAISTEPGVLPQYPEHFLTCSSRVVEGNSISTIIEKDYDYFDEPWYTITDNEQQSGWVVYNNQSSLQEVNVNSIVSYSKALFGADSTKVGVIATEMSLHHLSKILAEEKPYPHSYFIMIDEEGRYVAHPDSTRLFNKTIFSMADPQKQADMIALGYEMTKGNRGDMSVVIDGNPSLVCYKPVPGTTWSIAIICSDDDILIGYNKFFYIVVSLLAVALLLIILYCHEMVARSLRPLRKLLVKTQVIAKGNMDVKVERSSRVDDIGGLQNSYATMLESLRRYTDSVRDASEEAQAYNEELEHATQLVVEADMQKTAFIHNMTHQVRTPLNIIMGFAQIINTPKSDLTALDDASKEEIRNLAASMNHNSKLLNRMVLMLIDSSDSGVSEAELCQQQELVVANRSVVEMVDYVMSLYPDVHIAFETEVPHDFVVKTNKKYLEYSLGELLLNAVKYSDREHITVRVTRTESTVRFIIQDTGKGIAEADRENIFKFFTKVDDFSEGLGLGLPLTKQHAQNLGGSLTLDPDYHDGCRFILELPL